LSAKVLLAIQVLRAGNVAVRISADAHRPIHAKVFRGDRAVTIGSSNFSQAGLEWQIEANARFTASDPDPTRFDEACQFADHLWSLGSDYSAGRLALLEQLLQPVTWQEALARACAEVLEGKWAQRYAANQARYDAPMLWPSPRLPVSSPTHDLARPKVSNHDP